jgi:hypothetical protein
MEDTLGVQRRRWTLLVLCGKTRLFAVDHGNAAPIEWTVRYWADGNRQITLTGNAFVPADPVTVGAAAQPRTAITVGCPHHVHHIVHARLIQDAIRERWPPRKSRTARCPVERVELGLDDEVKM